MLNLGAGYKDRLIETGRYELVFKGNGFTSLEDAEKYWHRRAAELCKGEYTYEFTNDKLNNDEAAVPIGAVFVPMKFSKPNVSGIVRCKSSNSEEKSPEDSATSHN